MALKSIPSSNYSAKNIALFDAITTSASGTTTLTGTLTGLDRYTSVELFLSVTATSGTTPTLDLYIQKMCADGVSFNDLVHFGQYTTVTTLSTATLISQIAAPYTIANAALGAGLVRADHIGHTWQIKYVLGGTTPVYTFQLWGSFYE